MKIYPDLNLVMRRGRMFHVPTSKKAPVLEYVLAIMAMLLLGLLLSSCDREAVAAERGIVPAEDVRAIAQILYGESASDPEGWLPKLNTYYRAKRPTETILAAMKRVSSAYRTNSRQFKKAKTGDLNEYEQKVFKRLLAEVALFVPDPEWDCVHHEDFSFYESEEEAIAHLRKAWGDCVDFKNPIKIGREHYFRLAKNR